MQGVCMGRRPIRQRGNRCCALVQKGDGATHRGRTHHVRPCCWRSGCRGASHGNHIDVESVVRRSQDQDLLTYLVGIRGLPRHIHKTQSASLRGTKSWVRVILHAKEKPLGRTSAGIWVQDVRHGRAGRSLPRGSERCDRYART